MYDGAELGKAIAAHAGDLEAALTEYEEALFIRSANASVEAARIHALCFEDPNAPQGLLNLFTGALHRPRPSRSGGACPARVGQDPRKGSTAAIIAGDSNRS